MSSIVDLVAEVKGELQELETAGRVLSLAVESAANCSGKDQLVRERLADTLTDAQLQLESLAGSACAGVNALAVALERGPVEAPAVPAAGGN